MKTVLFCQNPYAFGILGPVMQVLKDKGDKYLWFVKDPIIGKFPFHDEPVTSNMKDVIAFRSDAIFVPGNEVPHYLRGLKVQVFHGLAGEKKGHFRIRHYFDLYLTQGPYFTRNFEKLKKKFKNFEVIETGWPKLDIYGRELNKYEMYKQELLEKYPASKILLYAPTFSPSLTSGPSLLIEFEKLADVGNYLILIKFHDLMSSELVDAYKQLAQRFENIIFEEERNIIKFLLVADLLISDTSSVVYEFLLLNKPVITFRNTGKQISWDDRTNFSELVSAVNENLVEDNFKEQRAEIFNEYHPYNDGLSAARMVNSVRNYIEENGVPEKRRLSFLRKRKIYKIFGKF